MTNQTDCSRLNASHVITNDLIVTENIIPIILEQTKNVERIYKQSFTKKLKMKLISILNAT